jgi:lysyl-tRNA synthetase class 2
MNEKTLLTIHFHFLKSIRRFFENDGFIDVLTSPAVPNPGFEPHIHPFALQGVLPTQNKDAATNLYLHTSPEIAMKKLLSLGFSKIFTLTHSFRDEALSPIHRPHFIMLEWYRTQERYEKIMSDTTALIDFCCQELIAIKALSSPPAFLTSFTKKTVAELFQEVLGIAILDHLDIRKLEELIRLRFPDVPLPPSHKTSDWHWDDFYFLLFLNKIEPVFKQQYPYLLLYEFPAPLAALSTIKKDDHRVCERFEIYIDGIEICNCFNELTDLKVQKERFEESRKLKSQIYHYQVPAPQILFDALEKGLPSSAGVALGVERLLMVIMNLPDIGALEI